jgi:hypothetical protein
VSYNYVPDGNDVLNIVVRQNLRLSEIIVIDILVSDHLPIIFSNLCPVSVREALDPIVISETVSGFKTSPLK